MILPDVLGPNLKVVFCGSAVGTASAIQGAYYAGPGNMFWPTLHRIGLTPHQLNAADYRTVLTYGIGLTDIVKNRSGGDASLVQDDFDGDGLRGRVMEFSPRVLAFNGKRAAKEYFGRKTVDYGLQGVGIGETVLFVLPSTSGAARGFWDEGEWVKLAEFLAEKWMS
jgi:TDG/mug DNA glycosylase family protein